MINVTNTNFHKNGVLIEQYVEKGDQEKQEQKAQSD